MIAIVDYQMGNLRSVQKALQNVGQDAVISSDPHVLADAAKVVLPGVGAFRDAIRELHERNWVEPLRDFIESGRPFLGICLGLQLLFDESDEGGKYAGLGVLPGRVVRFDPPDTSRWKVPHMGWNEVRPQQTLPLFAGIPSGAHFYFVHSYYVQPSDASVVAATADYPDAFCAMVARDNLFATQFHPEKSQQHGLQFLRNFGELDTRGRRAG